MFKEFIENDFSHKFKTFLAVSCRDFPRQHNLSKGKCYEWVDKQAHLGAFEGF